MKLKLPILIVRTLVAVMLMLWLLAQGFNLMSEPSTLAVCVGLLILVIIFLAGWLLVSFTIHDFKKVIHDMTQTQTEKEKVTE